MAGLRRGGGKGDELPVMSPDVEFEDPLAAALWEARRHGTTIAPLDRGELTLDRAERVRATGPGGGAPRRRGGRRGRRDGLLGGRGHPRRARRAAPCRRAAGRQRLADHAGAAGAGAPRGRLRRARHPPPGGHGLTESERLRVAVLGAGLMGSAIAAEYAAAGHAVRITTSPATSATVALARVAQHLGAAGASGAEPVLGAAGAADVQWCPTTAEAAAGADLVVESLPEVAAIKAAELAAAQAAAPAAILASNTSSLSLATLGA